jgi:hypothetical protein
MAGATEEFQPSHRIEENLKVLREDYARVEGKSFDHFFCPILFKDEDVPLCMGHIVNEAIPNSFGGCVVQRQDVDNWYGALAEADFVNHIQIRSMNPDEILGDPSSRRKYRPQMVVNGEVWEHYEYQGEKFPDHHTPVSFQIGKEKFIPWVVKKQPEEIEAQEQFPVELRLGKDCRLAAFVSLVKAAHLTLFKRMGYSYALSPSGQAIGHGMLGKFFKDQGHYGRRKPREALKDAAEFFRPHVNMMRTIDGFRGSTPRGTVEDGRADFCVTAGGKRFGVIVWVRTNSLYYAVLMPFFDDVEGAVAYDKFMTNSDTVLRVQRCQFEADRILVSQQRRETVWPKGDVSFSFD